jgi:hypothetical protein
MNLDGTAAVDNPFYDAGNGISARDYVFAYGLRNPFGGAWRASDGKHYQVENGPSVDRFSQVLKGASYGYNGSNASMTINAIYNWDPSHAPVNIAFVQQETFAGSRFPTSMLDHAFVTESGPTYAGGPQINGKRIVEFALDANGNRIGGPTTLVEYRGTGQGTIVGLAAGPDGLYFTELYEDSGANGPTATGARIFRVRYIGHAAGDYDRDNDADGNDFLAWQRTFGSVANLSADGNSSRIVDAGDLEVWKTAYSGAVAAATPIVAASSAPPEETETAVTSFVGFVMDGTPDQGGEPSDGHLFKSRATRSRGDEPNLQSGRRTEVRDRAFSLLHGAERHALRMGKLALQLSEAAPSNSCDLDGALEIALGHVFDEQ